MDTRDGDDAELVWTDPRTGQTFAVDKRTGNSYLLNAGTNDAAGATALNGRRTLQVKPSSCMNKFVLTSTGKRGTDGHERGACPAQEADAVPEWIREALAVSNLSDIPSHSILASGVHNLANLNIQPSRQTRRTHSMNQVFPC